MIRCLIFLLFALDLFAGPLKILQAKQQDNTIILTFNQTIKKSDFKTSLIAQKDSYRYIYDLNDAELTLQAQTFEFTNGKAKIAQNSKQKVRLVLSFKQATQINLSTKAKQAFLSIPNAKAYTKPISIASLFDPKNPQQTKPTAPPTNQKAPQKSPPKPTQTTKTIVIDPGHGGNDCGAIGVGGVCEKKVVLQVGLFLQEELKARGYRIFMTRSTDKFIKLQARTKFANDKNADLFVSIHANATSEHKHKLQGIESYFLSTARSERAKKVAALENKDDIETMNYFSKQSFLNTLNTQRLIASNRLAIDIQYGMLQALKTKYHITDGGVREGPFWVLAGALMPSVLLEIGYLTHPNEGERLNQSAFQKLIAKGIANGIDNYFAKNP